MSKFLHIGIVSILCLCLGVGVAEANNLKISKGSLVDNDDTTATLQFDISWENSWRASFNQPNNYDAVWVFIKFSPNNGINWYHAYLSPTTGDHSVPSGLEHKVGTTSGNGLGIFVQRSEDGQGNIAKTGLQVKWIFKGAGANPYKQLNAEELSNPDTLIKVMGIEMVYIPEIDFYAGTKAGVWTVSSFHRGSFNFGYWVNGGWTPWKGNDLPWHITQTEEDGGITCSVTNASDPFYYAQQQHGANAQDNYGANSGWSASGCGWATFTVPADFPKGYDAFYVMKYELSEEQYTDFLNMIDVPTSRFDTTGAYDRYTIQEVDGKYITSAPDRACGHLVWFDAISYLDWTGLRPLSELEWEKAARGGLHPGNTTYSNNPDMAEFAWGVAALTSPKLAYQFSGTEDGSEQAYTSTWGEHANVHTMSDGSNPVGAGPVRVGIFGHGAQGDRVSSGASYYGLMEMTGNLREYVVGVGGKCRNKWPSWCTSNCVQAGMQFSKYQHGDGVYQDGTWPSTWEIRKQGSSEIEHAGIGSRGGAYTGSYDGSIRQKGINMRDYMFHSVHSTNRSTMNVYTIRGARRDPTYGDSE